VVAQQADVTFDILSCSAHGNLCAEEDGDVVVEPGVKWEDLNAELKNKGIPLFFPVSHPPRAYEPIHPTKLMSS